jgi:hypothetical protein
LTARAGPTQQAPGFCAQKLSYFEPVEPAGGAAVPPAAEAVPSLDAPPVPPPLPVVPLDDVLVPLVAEDVPVEAVAPVVPVVPVDPVPVGVGVAVAVAVGVAVELEPVELVPEPLDVSDEAAAGAAPFGIVTVAGGPGTSGASGSPPPQPARRTVPSRRPSRPRRVPTALSAEGRTSGGRMWGSR